MILRTLLVSLFVQRTFGFSFESLLSRPLPLFEGVSRWDAISLAGLAYANNRDDLKIV